MSNCDGIRLPNVLKTSIFETNSSSAESELKVTASCTAEQRLDATLSWNAETVHEKLFKDESRVERSWIWANPAKLT